MAPRMSTRMGTLAVFPLGPKVLLLGISGTSCLRHLPTDFNREPVRTFLERLVAGNNIKYVVSSRGCVPSRFIRVTSFAHFGFCLGPQNLAHLLQSTGRLHAVSRRLTLRSLKHVSHSGLQRSLIESTLV